MTAADELHAMLDERGAEYTKTIETEGVLFTVITRDEYYFILARDGNAGIKMWSQYLTPEQAIAATLGAGTCKDVCSGVSEFTCSACGFNCDLASWISLFDGDDGRHRHHHHGTPRYCPNCGRKVVNE